MFLKEQCLFSFCMSCLEISCASHIFCLYWLRRISLPTLFFFFLNSHPHIFYCLTSSLFTLHLLLFPGVPLPLYLSSISTSSTLHFFHISYNLLSTSYKFCLAVSCYIRIKVTAGILCYFLCVSLVHSEHYKKLQPKWSFRDQIMMKN